MAICLQYRVIMMLLPGHAVCTLSDSSFANWTRTFHLPFNGKTVSSTTCDVTTMKRHNREICHCHNSSCTSLVAAQAWSPEALTTLCKQASCCANVRLFLAPKYNKHARCSKGIYSDIRTLDGVNLPLQGGKNGLQAAVTMKTSLMVRLFRAMCRPASQVVS